MEFCFKKILQPATCRTLCPRCPRQSQFFTILDHKFISSQQGSIVQLKGSIRTSLALPPASLPIHSLPTQGALKVAALVPLPAQASKRSRRSIFRICSLETIHKKRRLESNFPCYEQGMANNMYLYIYVCKYKCT